MIGKKYRVIDRNENCVLMETIESPKKYKVRDIENDDIMITVDKELAVKTFNKYDIEEVAIPDRIVIGKDKDGNEIKNTENEEK